MTYRTYEHPDFRRIALSFILRRKSYLSTIHRNGMTVDEFIEDVRSNVWRSGDKDLAHTTIIYNQVRWYIGRMNRKINTTKQLFDTQKHTSDTYNIDNIEEVNKILNLDCLSDRERIVLKLKYKGKSSEQIGKEIGRSRVTVNHIFESAAKKVKEEYDKVLG